MVPSTLIHTLTPVTHTHTHTKEKEKQNNNKNYNSKSIKIGQRVDLIMLKR